MYIKGVGMTKFDYSQKDWWQLAFEAAIEALKDAKMSISEIVFNNIVAEPEDKYGSVSSDNNIRFTISIPITA